MICSSNVFFINKPDPKLRLYPDPEKIISDPQHWSQADSNVQAFHPERSGLLLDGLGTRLVHALSWLRNNCSTSSGSRSERDLFPFKYHENVISEKQIKK